MVDQKKKEQDERQSQRDQRAGASNASNASERADVTQPPLAEQGLMYQGQKVVACRESRDGDPGYQLSTIHGQVTITLEDNTEKVVNPDDIENTSVPPEPPLAE